MERPILFSGPMVRAILDGRKTMTRRAIRWPLLSQSDGAKRRVFGPDDEGELNELLATPQRYPTRRLLYCLGMRLWVRETWYDDAFRADEEPPTRPDDCIYYRADGEAHEQFEQLDPPGARIWRPSIHMPRWASRIDLEITDVRIERLQDISEEDARAEGVERIPGAGGAVYPSGQAYRRPSSYRESFQRLWDSINAKSAPWASNPFVWVVAFKRAHRA